MKRVFVAISIVPGDTMLKMISSLKTAFRNERINWADDANIHLTLAFLGDTEEERINAADIAVREKCRGLGEFSIALAGTGVFRNFSDPRVIWAGIKECEQLTILNDQIVRGLKDAGFMLEERRFRPHITLGRIKSLSDPYLLESELVKYRDLFLQQVCVKNVILFESILKPSGPVYKPLGKYMLA